ncbi:hypothetical protein HXX76_001902 [Chlamydomonas incerta]|uniref:N-acetyltransferase domain-containing protein n=1 Tax=Chlamydomonas incerta TaxID=51695 RepID=A0A835WA23_CHLIN|nr:hypothetical protein HXX76_001902 [Chlamydomonas incerta]|eukprot:KAG2443550.1 hypothetical protein HXX76_001902 [Chlamydomonas incerta]
MAPPQQARPRQPTQGAASATNGSRGGFNPAKVDAKVYLANERTLLTWMRQAVLLGGLGAAACGLASYHHLRGSGGGGGGRGSAAAASSVADLQVGETIYSIEAPHAEPPGGSGGDWSGVGDHGSGAAAASMTAAAQRAVAAAAAAARVSPQELVSRLGGMALMLLGAGVAAAACRNYYLRVGMIRSGEGSDSARWDSKVLPRLLTGCLAAVMAAVFVGSLNAAIGSSHSTKEGPAGTAPCKHVGATLAVRIRRATPDDSPALASLDASCAADGSSGWSEGIYRTDLQPGGPNLILVAEAAEAAEVGEESIGSAAGGDGSGARCSTAGGAGGLLALAAGSEAGGEVSLTNVAVAAACRGAGLGRRITVELLRRLGSERCTSFLEVRVDNAAAQALYARLGFAVAGRRKRYNPDGSDSFVMTRPPGPLS